MRTSAPVRAILGEAEPDTQRNASVFTDDETDEAQLTLVNTLKRALERADGVSISLDGKVLNVHEMWSDGTTLKLTLAPAGADPDAIVGQAPGGRYGGPSDINTPENYD